uniref:Arginine/serine-rich protein 1 n=1 Tax=Ascaris lumbricoides TaxID=6252 RepID=A0A0M3IFT9_ASCLU
MVTRSRSVSVKRHRTTHGLTRSALAKQRPRDSHGRFLPTRRRYATPAAVVRLSRRRSSSSSSRSYGIRSRSTSNSHSTSQSLQLRRHSLHGVGSSRHHLRYRLSRTVSSRSNSRRSRSSRRSRQRGPKIINSNRIGGSESRRLSTRRAHR